MLPAVSLDGLPLFAGLSPTERQDIESRMRRREFAPQQTIVREGGPGDAAFLVVSGLVAVRRRDEASGVEFLLAELGPGQMFGEMALITGKPRTATVAALEPTSCAVLERGEFDAALRLHPGIALALARVLADRLDSANRNAGIDFVSLSRIKIDPRVLTLLPAALVNAHRCVPIAFVNNRLTLAMTDPNNIVALDDVRRILKGVMIEPAAVAEEDFRRFMATTYAEAMAKTEHAQPAAAAKRGEPRPGARTDVAATVDLLQSDIIRELQLADDQSAVVAETKQDLMIASEDAPIVKLSNSVLGLAIKQGASDIHIEPMESDVVLRYRIDGVLQVVQRLPKRVQMGLVSRLKILSRLDIAEKRVPQDGRFAVTLDGRPIDFRVSTVPGKWGEKIVLRILDRSNTQLGLDHLISHRPTLGLVREMIGQPYGIVYVTGPTGSGKTTTLYSALAEINDPGINIATAEDPIEYDLPGITQIQVNPSIDLTFASILRAFLRQDPDVMLVGETRDRETARTSVEAALTGHLVFTTLHTNSAAVAFTRLAEMGIEPFLVSSSTIGVVAQRLARRLCQACREPYEPDAETRRFFGLADGTTLYRGRGCSSCGGKGVKGRVGIYEVMRITPAVRPLIARGSAAEDIHAAAVAAGMIDLRRYAALMLEEGLTSIEEVTSVVSMDGGTHPP
jgi:type IV pilus assembly protein PilB